jgi:hypothetical protein
MRERILQLIRSLRVSALLRRLCSPPRYFDYGIVVAVSVVTLFALSAHDSWGQAAVMPGWKNPGWRGDPNPVVRPRPKPVPRPYRGYGEEVFYQFWGLGKGGCKAAYEMAHGMGDLAYGAVQCGGYAIGCGAWGLGVVDNPARLVPPNPGSWQSGSITAYDLQCKNGQGSQALCEMVINASTFNILPTCEAIADSLCTGSDEGMQAIGGMGVGVAVPALLGPVVRPVMRPVAQPVLPGAMVPKPISLPVVPGGRRPIVLPPKRLVLDVGCGAEGSLTAPLLPGDVVIGIDPLLKPGKFGLRCSIFDKSVLAEFRGACDEIILTGCKTGKDNVAQLEKTCAELLRDGGRVTVIDQYRGGCSSRSNQSACNPDTVFYKPGGPLQLIDGCTPRGHYPLPEWAKGLKFYETDGCEFPSGTYWRAWEYYRR